MPELFTDSLSNLSFQMKRILSEQEQDLRLWGGSTLEEIWNKNLKGDTKTDVRKTYDAVIREISAMRKRPSDYLSFNPDFCFASDKTEIVPDFPSAEKIMGRCPCPDESDTLRCCNLKTLDAVQQCAFACSYCSIQSFYCQNKIRVVSDLDEYLGKLDPGKEVWHIGTGQSSDSLLLGDDYGTLTALNGFAEKHPEIFIELKTKAARTDWIKMNLAPNIVSTWSVNAKTFSQKEEHLASSPEARINAAKSAHDAGRLVGFHIHPMCWFEGWKEEYGNLVRKLVENFNPENVVMVGLGTLTFTKQNLRTIRESGRPTLVTHIDFEMVAGKYSYPFETKKEMFSYVYSLFPQDWKDNVFFYLCMEDKSLWQPCLGRCYNSNEEFEEDMKKHYMGKVEAIREKN